LVETASVDQETDGWTDLGVSPRNEGLVASGFSFIGRMKLSCSFYPAASILQPSGKIKWFGDSEFTQERRGGEDSVLAQWVAFVLGEQVPGLGCAGRYRL